MRDIPEFCGGTDSQTPQQAHCPAHIRGAVAPPPGAMARPDGEKGSLKTAPMPRQTREPKPSRASAVVLCSCRETSIQSTFRSDRQTTAGWTDSDRTAAPSRASSAPSVTVAAMGKETHVTSPLRPQLQMAQNSHGKGQPCDRCLSSPPSFGDQSGMYSGYLFPGKSKAQRLTPCWASVLAFAWASARSSKIPFLHRAGPSLQEAALQLLGCERDSGPVGASGCRCRRRIQGCPSSRDGPCRPSSLEDEAVGATLTDCHDNAGVRGRHPIEDTRCPRPVRAGNVAPARAIPVFRKSMGPGGIGVKANRPDVRGGNGSDPAQEIRGNRRCDVRTGDDGPAGPVPMLDHGHFAA